jgi:hypothetical protein
MPLQYRNTTLVAIAENENSDEIFATARVNRAR